MGGVLTRFGRRPQWTDYDKVIGKYPYLSALYFARGDAGFDGAGGLHGLNGKRGIDQYAVCLVAVEHAEHIVVMIRVFGNAGVGVGAKCCCHYSYDEKSFHNLLI